MSSKIKEKKIHQKEEKWTVWTHKIWVLWLYGYLTYIGIVLSWNRFKAFGINIFDFAELNDFLLAAFRNPTLFALTLGMIPVAVLYLIIIFAYLILLYCVFYYMPRHKGITIKQSCSGIISRFSSWKTIKKTFKSAYSWKNIKCMLVIGKKYTPNWLLWLVIFATAIILPWYTPIMKKSYSRLPELNVEVLLKDFDSSNEQKGWIKDLILIGATEKYVFFDRKRSGEGVLIAPVSNIILIKENTPLECVADVH